MPVAAVRRPVTITAWILLSTLYLVLSPLLLAVAALAGALMRKPQPLLLARLLLAYFSRELAVIVACGGLWLISGAGMRVRSRRFQRLHFQLLCWYLHGMVTRALSLLSAGVQSEPSPEATRALERDRPLLFFSRHAGPGDTALLVDLLMTRYRRLPSVVFKEALAIDPGVDLLGHRLPQAILDTDDREECERVITDITARLGPRGVLMLFPEGANFTVERKRSAVRKLASKGRRREAAEAEEMDHVLPPHPTGALAALQGNPDADVIFGAHTGLGVAAFPRQLWRDPPIGRTFKSKMWLVGPGERPSDPDEQAQWLYDWWKRIDDWIGQEGQESPHGQEGQESPDGSGGQEQTAGPG